MPCFCVIIERGAKILSVRCDCIKTLSAASGRSAVNNSLSLLYPYLIRVTRVVYGQIKRRGGPLGLVLGLVHSIITPSIAAESNNFNYLRTS